MGATTSRHAREPRSLRNLPTETIAAAQPRQMYINAARDHGVGTAEHTPAPAAASLWIDALQMTPYGVENTERKTADMKSAGAKKNLWWKNWWKHLLHGSDIRGVQSVQSTEPIHQGHPLQAAATIQPEILNQPNETNARPTEATPAQHEKTTEPNTHRALPMPPRPAIPKRASSLGKCYKSLSTKHSLRQRTASCPSTHVRPSADHPVNLEQMPIHQQIRARRAQARVTSGTFTCASPRGVSLSPIGNPYLPYGMGREGIIPYSTASTIRTSCVSPTSGDGTSSGEYTSGAMSPNSTDVDQIIRKMKTICTPRDRAGYAYSSFHEVPDPAFSVTSRYKHHRRHHHHHRRRHSSPVSSSSSSSHLCPPEAKLDKGKQRARSPSSDEALSTPTPHPKPPTPQSHQNPTTNILETPTNPTTETSTTKTHRPPPEIFSTLVYLDGPVAYSKSDLGGSDGSESGLEKWEKEVRDAFGLRGNRYGYGNGNGNGYGYGYGGGSTRRGYAGDGYDNYDSNVEVFF